jgi:L-alanine-DL-glutamate epimerase-like enolase superfamily enzyme
MSGATRPEPTYALIADLPLQIDAYSIEPLERHAAPPRRTAAIVLHGADETGVGEDITPTGVEHPALPLAGDWTIDAFSRHLATLDLFRGPPPHPMLRPFRRWAFESAALDLALRQAGRSLTSALGRVPRPVTFVNSPPLPDPPTIEPVRRRLEQSPGLRLKLDPTARWDDELIAELAATGAVDVLDLKGQYPPQAPVAQPPDPDLYERVARAFPDAWIEDPAITPETRKVLQPHEDRIAWDAPVRTLAKLERLPTQPRALNIKPVRLGTLHALLDVYDHCLANDITMYGGGFDELGPGRDQIQYLAALFHPNAPNDVAPAGYNETTPAPTLPTSPLVIAAGPTGFRQAQPV